MSALHSKSAKGQHRSQSKQQYPVTFQYLQLKIVEAERAQKPDAAIERIQDQLERALRGNKISPYLGALTC